MCAWRRAGHDALDGFLGEIFDGQHLRLRQPGRAQQLGCAKASIGVLKAQGDDILKSTRQLWLYGLENVPAKHAQRFDEIKELNLETSRAWAIKEVFRSFWLCDTVKKAGRYFGQWYGWAIRSRLEPVKKVARMCKRT